MKIYFIRHSESEDDILNCYGGSADFMLTDAGRNKVLNFCSTFKNLEVEKIFSSPLKRAFETAKILSENSGDTPIEVIFDIRELNCYGVMSGVNKDKAKEIFGWLLKLPEYKEFGYSLGKTFYGGEDIAEFDARVKNAVENISNSGLNKVAVVTHGGVLISIFKNIFNEKRKIKSIDDVALIETEYVDGKFKVLNTSGVSYID